MIRTDKQLTANKEQISKFEQYLSELEGKRNTLDPLDYRLEKSGLNNLLRKIRAETAEYEMLSDPNTKSAVLKFEIHDFPDSLIKARLVRKMSQSELAKKIGVEPQQIQRYESNGYSGVGFDRLLQIQYALKFEVQCEAQIFDHTIFSLDGQTEEEINENQAEIKTDKVILPIGA